MVHYPSIYPADSALFIPAISTAYTGPLPAPTAKMYRPLPAGLTATDLNFLSRDSRLFSIGCGLYSGGPALGSARRAAKLDMVTTRASHNAEIIADSGGFQVAQGIIIPVSNGEKVPSGKTKWMGHATLDNLASFAERCDWCPTLDFPRAMLDLEDETATKNIAPYLSLLRANGGVDPSVLLPGVPVPTLQQLCDQNGLGPEFNTALWYTIANTEVLRRDPRIASKLWAVYQGKGLEEARIWARAMASYRFPGVCYAGIYLVWMEQTIERIVEDLAARNFDHIRRLHFLGTGEMQNICSYSTLQRCLREETGHDIIITADAASPFLMAADGMIVMGFKLGTVDWTFMSASISDLAAVPAATLLEDALYPIWEAQVFRDRARTPCVNPTTRTKQINQHFFVRSEISKRITVEDLKLSLNKKRKWKVDSIGTRLLMNHNTQIYMEGMVTALTHYHANTPNMIPSQLIAHREAIEKVFATPPEQRQDFIESCSDDLNILAWLTNAANKRIKFTEGLDERWEVPAGFGLPKKKKAVEVEVEEDD